MLRVELAVHLSLLSVAAFDEAVAGNPKKRDEMRLRVAGRDALVASFGPTEYAAFSAWAGCTIIVETLPAGSPRVASGAAQ